MLNRFKNSDNNKLDSIINEAIGSVFNKDNNQNDSGAQDNEIKAEKYDNRGRIITNTIDDSNDELETADEWDTVEEYIEFGILDFNKSSVSTKKEWIIEDDRAGAFFIYNSTEDLSWSKIYLRDKETQEIIWMSPLRDLPSQIKIDNCKSRVVYMSSKAIFTENIQNTSGSYELFIGDNDNNSIEFVISDIRNDFEDVVVKYEENKSAYLINHILKYSNYEISRKDVSNISNKYNSSIIIEKIGDKYSVLLNKPQNVINKVLFLRDNANSIYHNCDGTIDDILSTIEKTMDIRYGTTIEEFNDLNKLIITDEVMDVNDINLDIVSRKDILQNALSKDIVLIDKYANNTNIMLYDEQGKVLTISLEHLNNEDIEELCTILNHKQIVITGIIQEDNELEVGTEKSLSMLVCNN